MKNQGVPAIKIAAAYISTVVGAGFATGQEVLQFFTRFGITGTLGLAVATTLFVFFGYRIMLLGRKLHARSHLVVIRFCAHRFAPILDGVIAFFLLGALATMLAGNSALFGMLFQNGFAGGLLMAALTAMTVLGGFKGVVNSMSVVAPFLLAAVFITGIASLFGTSSAPPVQTPGNQPGWLFTALLYVSYNILLSIAVLSPLGAESQNTKAILFGALLGGIGLGLGALMIHSAMLHGPAAAMQGDMPMLYLAQSISPTFRLGYAMVLSAEIYTTATSSLFGFAARFANRDNAKRWRAVVLVTTCVALMLSRLGFVKLVAYFYPLVGLCGIALLVCLVGIRQMPEG